MSNTTSTELRRKRNHKKAGQRRKKVESKRSTLTTTELFAGFGEPGKPAPKSKLRSGFTSAFRPALRCLSKFPHYVRNWHWQSAAP